LPTHISIVAYLTAIIYLLNKLCDTHQDVVIYSVSHVDKVKIGSFFESHMSVVFPM